ncbi:MAG: PHP domain-containing protein [Nitrospirae bacterium]|nr:PHP domain-containing protein [Nitrospirota bacterium]
MLKQFKADLHIHTCLSPCADIEMSPKAVVKTALERGIDMIAVTDHNSAENVEAVMHAAEGSGLAVLCGMEASTVEEVHILALFEGHEGIIKLQEMVYNKLMPGRNDPEIFGEQVIADEEDDVLGFNDRLLISATGITAKSLVDTVHALGGIAIASHIDREGFGIISQLGFIPDDCLLDALEFSSRISFDKAKELYGNYSNFAWLSSSDAHRLEDIGKRTTVFTMESPTFTELVYALKNMNSRKAVWE